MADCIFCGGKLELQEIDVTKNWRGRQVTFHGIPAEVCSKCGEQYLLPGDIHVMEMLSETLPASKETPEIMDVRDVAEYLRVSTQTVYNLLKSGKLQAAKVGREWRFRKESVINALQVCEQTRDSGVRRPKSHMILRDKNHSEDKNR